MSTYGDMQDRIADELARSDLETTIQRAILSAIKHYERRRFYFNETAQSFSTVADQSVYTATDADWIATAVRVDDVRITINGSLFQLDRLTLREINFLTSGVLSQGDPTSYNFSRETLTLYPTPNAVRTITADFVQRLTALSERDDTNAWVDDAEELIRLRAKMILFRDVIRDFDEMNALAPAEAEALHALSRETNQRTASGRVVAYSL